MLTDTPTTTNVVASRLRRIGSRSVPAIGLSPWMRESTRSDGCTSKSATTSVAGVPRSSRTGNFSIAPNSRALWLEPRSSVRRPATQCTTGTPAARAAAHSSAPLGRTVPRAVSASAGNADDSPITPFWHSLVTSAARVRSACTWPAPPSQSERQDAASGQLAGFEVVNGGLHVLERVAGRDELVELEPTTAVEVDVAPYIPLRLRRSVAAAEHRLVEVHRRDVERGLGSRRRDAEHDAGAAPVEQVDRGPDQADVPHALEGVVDTSLRHVACGVGALHEVRRAELQRDVTLPGIGVDRDDRARSRQRGTLDHVEADAA